MAVHESATTPTADEFIARRKADIAKHPWVKAKDVLRTGAHWHRLEAAHGAVHARRDRGNDAAPRSSARLWYALA